MSALNDTLTGQQLDEYVIEKPLGSGSMAHVYRAFDTRLRRTVALKVIAPHFSTDQQYTARFEREAQSIARLDHPNIVHIYRFGEVNNVYYMAMQYIEGVDVAWLIEKYHDQGEIMPLQDIVRIVAEIGAALDYAHQRGVIHRDVKPRNMMIDRTGRAILTDFGIALVSGSDPERNASGSPPYIAPEQAVSADRTVPQSDIYSLGVSLFQMLTAELPFAGDGNPAEVAMRHIRELPPPPSQSNPAVPAAVDGVVLRAMKKDPSERFQKAENLGTALQVAVASWDSRPVTGSALLPSEIPVADKAASHLQPAPPDLLPELPAPDHLPMEPAPRVLPPPLIAGPARPLAATMKVNRPRPVYSPAAPSSQSSIDQWREHLSLSPLAFAGVLLLVASVCLLACLAAAILSVRPRSVALIPTQTATVAATATTVAATATMRPIATFVPTFTPVNLGGGLVLPPPAPTTMSLPPPSNRTVPPPNSHRLGEFAVEWYCNNRGFGVILVNNQNDWACINTSNNSVVFTLGPSDFDSICRSTYQDQGAFAIRDQQKPAQAFNWSCYTYNAGGAPAGAQPASATVRLGEFTVEQYCTDRGYGVTLVNNQSDWACIAQPNGSVALVLGQSDFDAICKQRYGDSQAFAVRDQHRDIQAYNWSCYTNR